MVSYVGAVCCSVLQCVAVCCSVLQCVAVPSRYGKLCVCRVLQCAAVCVNRDWCVAVCRSVRQEAWVHGGGLPVTPHCNIRQVITDSKTTRKKVQLQVVAVSLLSV